MLNIFICVIKLLNKNKLTDLIAINNKKYLNISGLVLIKLQYAIRVAHKQLRLNMDSAILSNLPYFNQQYSLIFQSFVM